MTVPLSEHNPAIFQQSESILGNSPIKNKHQALCILLDEFLHGPYSEFQDQIKYIDSFLDNADIQVIVFCRLGDGIEETFLPVANRIVEHYVISGRLAKDNFAYLSNIDRCSRNIQEYQKLQVSYPYLPDHLCSRTNTGDLAGGSFAIWCNSDIDIAFTQYPKHKNFLCFNRGLRLPRIVFMMEMAHRGLLDNSYASLNLSDGTPDLYQMQVVTDIVQCNAVWMNETGFDSNKLGSLISAMPLKLGYDTSRLFSLNDADLNLFRTTRLSIVNEALFHSSHRHHLDQHERGSFLPFSLTSEKVLKCMMMGHPFILISTPGHLAAIRELGYKTFHNVIDESYDSIHNDHDRMQAALSEIERLNGFTDAQWADFEHEIKDTVRYNQLVFKEKAIDHPYIAWLNK